MTSEPSNDLDPTVPNKNPIIVLAVLGGLNLLAATLVVVLQAGIVIVGKSTLMAHVVLTIGWLVTGALGCYLLHIAQGLLGKRKHARDQLAKEAALEHTRELDRKNFMSFGKKSSASGSKW